MYDEHEQQRLGFVEDPSLPPGVAEHAKGRPVPKANRVQECGEHHRLQTVSPAPGGSATRMTILYKAVTKWRFEYAVALLKSAFRHWLLASVHS